METTNFRLVGLSKPKKATLRTDNEMIFWAEVKMTRERFSALFDYCKGNWSEKKVAVIEHDGFYKDGTPRNPTMIEIIDN